MTGKTKTRPVACAIVLPLPGKALSPNYRPMTVGGRMSQNAATQKYKTLACDAIDNLRLEGLPWKGAICSLTFYWKNKRKRDIDNANASMKSAYDGAKQAGLIPDDDSDHLTHIPTEFSFDKLNPRVELLFTEVI